MNIVRYYLSIVFYLIFFLPVQADIPTEQTRGLYDAVLNEYKHLSPFHGFVAAHQKTFDGYYHYTLASESVYKLMHQLFRFVDTLIPQISDSAIGTHLDAPMLGKLLAGIEKHLDRPSGLMKVSKEELKKTLLEVLNQTGTRMKQKTKVGPREAFAQILIDALDEAGHFSPQQKNYPQFIVHDMLLTLLFKKVNDKATYQTYFNQFKVLNNGNGILKSDAAELLAKSYEDPADPNSMAQIIVAQLHSLFSQMQADQLFNEIIKQYEPYTHASIKMGGRAPGADYPPQVAFDSTLLSWFQKNPTIIQQKLTLELLTKQYGFFDCMETALRNLLMFIEYNAATDNFKGHATYFQEFNIKTIISEQARTAWADLVSDIPNVKYNKRVKEEKSSIIIETAKNAHNNIPWVRPAYSDGWYYYELEPTLFNIVLVVNRVFNLNLKDFAGFLKHFNLECPFQGTEEKGICTFTDESKKSCSLDYHPLHAFIKEYSQGKETLLDFIRRLVGMQISTWNGSHFLPILNLYKVNFTDLGKAMLQSNLFRHALLIQQLRDITVKLEVIPFIMRNFSELKDNVWYRSFILTLTNEGLSLNDENTSVFLLRQWAQYALSWNMLKELGTLLQHNMISLDDQTFLYSILKPFIQSIPLQYPHTDTAVQFLTQNSKMTPGKKGELLLTVTEILYQNNSEIAKKLFWDLSAKNFKDPDFIPYLMYVLVTYYQSLGISKEQTLELIKNWLPYLKQTDRNKHYRFYLNYQNTIKYIISKIVEKIITLEATYLNIKLAKEIILELLPEIDADQSISLIYSFEGNSTIWGNDFIAQVEALIKK